MIFILNLFLLCSIPQVADCSCSFPSDLTGEWYMSMYGSIALQFSSTTNSLSIPYGGLPISLECMDQSSNLYALVSSSLDLGAGMSVYVGICFLFEKIRTDIYSATIKTGKNALAQDQRMEVMFFPGGSINSICTDLNNNEQIVVLRKDGDWFIDCPTEILGHYTFDFTHGSCSASNVVADFCTDTKTLDFVDTESCSKKIGYSASSKVKCIHHKTLNSKNYIWTYNTNADTDEQTTFLFTCFMYELSGNSLKMTQNPRYCDAGQTATNAMAVVPFAEVKGGKFTGQLKRCPTTTTITTTPLPTTKVTTEITTQEVMNLTMHTMTDTSMKNMTTESTTKLMTTSAMTKDITESEKTESITTESWTTEQTTESSTTKSISASTSQPQSTSAPTSPTGTTSGSTSQEVTTSTTSDTTSQSRSTSVSTTSATTAPTAGATYPTLTSNMILLVLTIYFCCTFLR